MRIFLFLWFVLMNSAKAQNLHWVKSIGGKDADWAGPVQLDAAGNIYVVGSFKDTVDFDPGPGIYTMTSLSSPPYNDIFILKLDPDGAFKWSKQISGCMGGNAYVDNTGNLLLTGYFTGFADLDPGPGSFMVNSFGGGYYLFASKLDSSGNFLWGTSIGSWGGSCMGLNVCSDSYSNVYLAGIYTHPSSFPNYVDFDPGPSTYLLSTNGQNDVFLLKLNSAGSFLWAKSFGGVQNDGVGPMQVKANGEFLIAGNFDSGLDLDPGPSNYFVSPLGPGSQFVSRFDSAGHFIWGKAYGGGIPTSVLFDASDNVYLSGYFSGTQDFDTGPGSYTVSSNGGVDSYVLKLTPSGHFNWARNIGGSWHDHNAASQLDSKGNVYTTGSFSGTVDFDPGPNTSIQSSSGWYDTYLVKLDSLGNFGYAKTFIGQDSSCASFPYSMDSSPADEIFLSGVHHKTVDFDPGYLHDDLTSNGIYDVFVLKLGACNLTLGRDSLLEACKGEAITLSTHEAALYNWNPGSVSTNSLSFFADSSITYTLIAQRSPDCSDTIQFHVQVSLCLGVDDNNFVPGNSLMVFPNPTNGAIQIKGDQETTVVITDVLGRQLLNFELKAERHYSQSIELQVPGVYYLISSFGSQKLLVND